MAHGSVRKRGKSWTYIIPIGFYENGQVKYKWVGGFKTKAEAEREKSIALAEVYTGNYIEQSKLTLAQYLKEWFEGYSVNLAPSTARGYRVNIQKHINPLLGFIRLSDLNPILIQRAYNQKIKEGLSPTTVIYMHRVLHKALKQAVKLRMIRFNPAEDMELPKKKQYKSQVLNEEQVKKMLNTAKETNAYISILLAVGLGLRRGEVLGLMWEDIDFDRKVVSINRSVVYEDRQLRIGDLKTRSSRRSILISDGIAKALKEHRQKESGFVVSNEDQPLSPATLDKQYKAVLKKAGLPNIRFHDLRHTNATLMLKAGIHAKVASQRLGHSTIGITMDLYSHVMHEMQEEAARILDVE